MGCVKRMIDSGLVRIRRSLRELSEQVEDHRAREYYLFINGRMSPTVITRVNERVGRIELDEEGLMRSSKLQFSNTTRRFNLKDAALLEAISRQHLFAGIEEFINRHIGECCCLWMIFQGHGSPSGYCLSDCTVCLDEILQLLSSMSSFRVGYSFTVKVVFSQCYGHMYHEQYNRKPFEVFSLSNDRQPETWSLYEIDDATGKVVNSQQLSLINFFNTLRFLAHASVNHNPREYDSDEQMEDN